MKKLLLSSLLILGVQYLSGQITTNLDMETWTASGSYENPSNGWSSLNAIDDLTGFGPITVTKSTDAYSGTYAAKLETGKIPGFGTLIGGILATGYFDNSASPGQNLKLGVPFTSTPSHLRGYYKYLPVNGDSADIFCALTKWNTSTSSRDTLGWVGYRELNTISTYTQFNLKIDYTDSISTPDTIIMLFSSSSGADNFQGQEGSTMFIDAISLPNSVGVYELLNNDISINVYPNPSTEFLTINTEHNDKLIAEVYDAKGQLVLTKSFTKKTLLETSNMNNGNYYLSIKDSKGLVASERFIISH